MDTTKEREVETHKTAVANDGRVVQERTRSVGTEASTKTTIINVIWFIYGLVAILLAIRFIFKLTGANGESGFVKFIYSITDFLSKPFDSVFGVKTASTAHFTSVFEPSILVAIAVYGLIAWGIVKLININRPKVDSIT
jgi:hypothetical protein